MTWPQFSLTSHSLPHSAVVTLTSLHFGEHGVLPDQGLSAVFPLPGIAPQVAFWLIPSFPLDLCPNVTFLGSSFPTILLKSHSLYHSLFLYLWYLSPSDIPYNFLLTCLLPFPPSLECKLHEGRAFPTLGACCSPSACNWT